MINSELIDDYLANRLQEQDRKSFELQMEGDPSLREEVEFQRLVVEGVRQARAAELKTMLKNVPVNGNSWSGGKMAAGIFSAGLVATLLYFYTKEEDQAIAPNKSQQQEIVATPDAPPSETIPAGGTEKKQDQSLPADAAKDPSTVTKDNDVVRPVTKPDIHPVDPSGEFSESTEPKDVVTPGRSEITVSKMEVVTGLSDKKHNFHYQFVEGKLLLYGPFDNSLYEVLEIHGEGHAVFLFYKENYYLLDETQSAITKLDPIRDSHLLRKLKEYRGR